MNFKIIALATATAEVGSSRIIVTGKAH